MLAAIPTCSVIALESADPQFAPGPHLDRRQRLHTQIRAAEAKGVGVSGYLKHFEDIETGVKNGLTESEISAKLDRVEKGLAQHKPPERSNKSVADLLVIKSQLVSGKKELTTYCMTLEKILGEKFRTNKELAERCVLLKCIVSSTGEITQLKADDSNDSKTTPPELKLSALKTVGAIKRFPKPPIAPFLLKMEIYRDPTKLTVYKGDFDFEPFMDVMSMSIRKCWFPPEADRSKLVVVVFKVYRNGQKANLRLLKSSGVQLADQAAIKAVQEADIPPLPDGSPKLIDINFTLKYNNPNNRVKKSY